MFKPTLYMGGITFHVTDYHIVIPSEDTPEALFNNKLIHGEQKRVLVVNPGDTVNCLKNAPAKPYYSFLIKPELIYRIAAEMDFTGEVRFENFLNPFSSELFRAFGNLERESSRPDRLNLLQDSLEIQIAVLLLREFKTNMNRYTPLLQNADAYICSAQEYIRTYCNSNITLKDICEEIHVSEYHFIRMFVKKVGVTPHRYLLMVRMEKAKDLLRTKQYSVAETAMLSGYESIPAFSTAFKRLNGVSPADYKRQFT
ncbi:MAG: helix-turn-helix transcriptional regulator [Oscillospiraceae bacterium]|nr:helix-turn-helix transcriptional regulator [Oscillospiraceae bacterium]